jgi:photosystem II stability/assembly factor-like uncharacterized protein
MDRSPRRGRGWSACALIAVTAALLALPSAAGAVTWTPITSGTASNITAIEYQSPSRFWFTTSNGEIYGRGGGGNFGKQRSASGLALNDIEFRPAPSEVGLAVGDGGQVLRTTNGGTSWETVVIAATVLSKAEPNNCTASQAVGNVYSVRFASSTVAYIIGQGSQLGRSTGTASTVGSTWVDANWEDKAPGGRGGEDVCKLFTSATNLGDAFFVNENTGFFCTQIFGAVFVTTNGLSTAGVEKAGGCGNGFTGSRHLAGDPANPNRMWAVGGNSKLDGTAMTVDAWGTAKEFAIANDTVREVSEPTDVAYAGGTVLSAGATGMILASNDGQNFYFNDATGSLAPTNWEAAALANGNDGAVGGAGGALAVTTDASNVVPPSTSPGPGATTPAKKDTKAPETTIVKKPKKKSAKRKVKFTFTSSEPGSTFECKLDKAKKYTRCKSPLKRKLKPGKHKFSVRAVDRAGNSDATPAVWKFKITAPH